MAMHKINFEGLKTALYEEITPEGLKVLVAPCHATEKVSCGIYVSTGAYRHEEMLDKIKTPQGLAHFLEHMLFFTPKGPALPLFEECQASANALTSESFTLYYFSTYEDYAKPLDLLLAMVTNLGFTDEQVNGEKEVILAELDQDKNDQFTILDEALLSNLYSKSPLKESILGDLESIKSIHLSNLKKYFQEKYGLDDLTLIVTGNVDPEPIHKFVTERKLLSKKIVREIKEEPNFEQYGQVVRPFDTVKGAYETDLIGLGVKFLPRMELYERYGDDLFAIYQLLPELLFGRTSGFLEHLNRSGLARDVELLELHEGGEDAALAAGFTSERADELKVELASYLSSAHKRIKRRDFALVKKDYLGPAALTIVHPEEYLLALSDCYANHVAYPAIVERVSSLRFKLVHAFLKDLETWPFTFVKVTKK